MYAPKPDKALKKLPQTACQNLVGWQYRASVSQMQHPPRLHQANLSSYGRKALIPKNPPAVKKTKIGLKTTQGSLSYKALMKRFKQHLNANWQDIYKCAAVEQAFVKMNSQKTYFILALDNQDTTQLSQYYAKTFPSLDLKVKNHTRPGWKCIIVDTRVLYNQLAPFMGHAVSNGYDLSTDNKQPIQTIPAIASIISVTASHTVKGRARCKKHK